MSFFDSAKDFFGLGPVDNAEDDAYYAQFKVPDDLVW